MLMLPEQAIEKLKDKNCKCCRAAKANIHACNLREVQFAIEIIRSKAEELKQEAKK